MIQKCKLNTRDTIMMFLLSTIGVVGVFIFRLTHYTLGIDTETFFCVPDSIINWCFGCGRFSAAFILKILAYLNLNNNYFMNTFLTSIILCLVNFMLLHSVKMWEQKRVLGVFVLLFLSFPSFAELFYFTSSGIAYSLGILCCVVYVILVSKWILKSQKHCLFLSVLVGAFAIGAYQVYLFLMIAGIIVFFIILESNSYYSSNFIFRIRDYVRCLSAVLLTVVFYFLAAGFFLALFYNPEFHYAGYTDAPSYITGQSAWKNGVGQCFENIKTYFVQVFDIQNIFGSIMFLVFLTCILIVLVCGGRRGKAKESIRYLMFLFGGIFVMPFAEAIVKGSSISVREQVVLPFVLAFFGFYILNHILKRKISRIVFAFLVVIMSIYQSIVSISLYKTDYVRYLKDCEKAYDIAEELQGKYGEFEKNTVVFVGGQSPVLSPEYLTGHIIGTSSFFSHDMYTDWGINYRVHYFMKTIGVNYKEPTIEEIHFGKMMAQQLTIWPAENSMSKTGDVIVVKLSELNIN